MPFVNFLFGGSLAGKVLLALIAVLTVGAGYALLRAKWKAAGGAEVKDKLRKEADDARGKMDAAGDRYRRDGGARKRLRDADF